MRDDTWLNRQGLASHLAVHEAVPEAIGALLTRPDQAAALGALGREHWQASFTWERSLPLFLDLIEGRSTGLDPLDMPAGIRARQIAAAKGLLARPGLPLTA